ncbi:MAG: hypothetical protein MUF54_08220 [Polyangiaceae bacterium]|nr:hypothetical protein [Polyangiaceae bacterium]
MILLTLSACDEPRQECVDYCDMLDHCGSYAADNCEEECDEYWGEEGWEWETCLYGCGNLDDCIEFAECLYDCSREEY